ncbi:MAG: AraC family transcriptional regulator [Pseudomonadota bacterium]
MDSLTRLLERLGVQAHLFYSGTLCESSGFTSDGRGHLHVLRAGELEVRIEGQDVHRFDEPTLLVLPRPLVHEFRPVSESGTELVCATLSFDGAGTSPILASLPRFVFVPFREVAALAPVLQFLFDEAFQQRFGATVTVNRTLEALLVLVLRYCVQQGLAKRGVLAALGDQRLSLAIDAFHARPEIDWTVERLAEAANMSRAGFAAQFRDVVGESPAHYVTSVRLSMACKALEAGVDPKRVASRCGFSGAASMSRTFKQRFGMTPRQWLAAKTN